jgi:hypothetical protein
MLLSIKLNVAKVKLYYQYTKEVKGKGAQLEFSGE